MRMLQDEGGASRDEIAAALVDVSEGRLPKDRIALRELYREIMDWPFVEAAPDEEEEAGSSNSSPYEAITPTGVEGKQQVLKHLPERDYLQVSYSEL